MRKRVYDGVEYVQVNGLWVSEHNMLLAAETLIQDPAVHIPGFRAASSRIHALAFIFQELDDEQAAGRFGDPPGRITL